MTAAADAEEQEDSSAVALLRDPASNRLFWMSTGMISEPGRASVGVFGAPYLFLVGIADLTVLQGGYSPNSFLQFNLSGSVRYWSVGTKIQAVSSPGFVRGLAIGADFGFFPSTGNTIPHQTHLGAYTVAGSFGIEPVELHLGAMQISLSDHAAGTPLPTAIQAGCALSFPSGGTRGAKLMAEFWMLSAHGDLPLRVALLLVGIRSYGSTFVWELAVLSGPKLDFGGSSKETLTLFPVPHCSLMWFL